MTLAEPGHHAAQLEQDSSSSGAPPTPASVGDNSNSGYEGMGNGIRGAAEHGVGERGEVLPALRIWEKSLAAASMVWPERGDATVPSHCLFIRCWL